ncbi:MAG: hypothetical protein JNK22_12150, partial [Rhodocyclaceae bacterium]|nr:hypothetical protein [Rhodocyclaceae bacterium]
LPLLLKPDARKVANIGLGSGLTTHTVLTHSGVERVDTVEIEPAMVAGATAFRARVPAAFADPRSHMQIEDAKTYFARHGVRYDVIISEPSNPWVSGVASLFTTEFYRDVRRHLKDDGLLVQWFHLYEVDDRLVSTVILALAENFDDFAIYLTDTTNMLIVAPRNGKLPPLQAPSPTQRAFIEGMARVGLRGPEDFAVRRLGDKAVALAAVSGFGVGPNSDFMPRLQLEATATRFTQARADIRNLGIAPLPVLEALDGRRQDLAQAASVTANPRLPRSVRLHEARQVRELLLARGRPWDLPDPESRLHVGTVTGASALCAESPVPESYSLHWVAERTIPYLPPPEAAALWSTPAWLPCRKPAAWLRERLDLYAAIARRDGNGISSLAGNMLARGPGAGELEWRRYVLSAAMFGEQLGGRSDGAAKLWRQYGDELYGGFPPPAAVRVLAGYRRPGSDGPR